MADNSSAAVRGIDKVALADYLPTVLDDYDEHLDITVQLLTGGRSNLTCQLSQCGSAADDGVKSWILRRPPLGHAVPSAHDMTREFRAPRPRCSVTRSSSTPPGSATPAYPRAALWAGGFHAFQSAAPDAALSRAALAAKTSYQQRALRTVPTQ
jgi:aminoglycoside phosphotransferase (APT) family kinase protein